MKLNVRNYALLASMATVIALAGSASAQRFYLSLPGTGGADAPTTIQAAADGKFTVEVWFQAGAEENRTTVGTHLGFDKSTTTGTSTTIRMQNVLNLDGAIDLGGTSGAFVGNTNFGGLSWQSPALRGGATAAAGNNIPAGYGATERPWGLNTGQAASGTWTIPAGVKQWMYTVKMVMAGAPGSIYGDDPSEAGLIVYKHKTAVADTVVSLGQSGVGKSGTVATYAGSGKYAVQIVPEPMTMIALGAGVAALISRRRKNS